MSIMQQGALFWQLLHVEFLIFKQTIVDKLLNSFVWAGTTIPIAGYILPLFGLSPEYAAFFAAGFGISCGWFEIFPQVANLIADLEGERHIDYQLTLPLSSWLIFLKMACATMANTFLMNTVSLSMAKVMLWHNFSLTKLSLIKLLIMLIVSSFFFGCFTILMASIVKNMSTIGNTFMRVMHPLCWLGGFQFSWKAICSFAPWLGYGILLNPYLYAAEGMRAAILGQSGYLPFWPCICMLLLFSVLFAWLGISRLKRRLDFI